MPRAPRPRPYAPPALQHRVTLRNPSDKPAPTRDRYGRETEPEEWGVQVWAGRRDRVPEQLLEEGAVVYAITTVWTVRERDGIAPDVEVVFGGKVWRSLGPPVERGGPDFGRRARYLEIHTKLRE